MVHLKTLDVHCLPQDLLQIDLQIHEEHQQDQYCSLYFFQTTICINPTMQASFNIQLAVRFIVDARAFLSRSVVPHIRTFIIIMVS